MIQPILLFTGMVFSSGLTFASVDMPEIPISSIVEFRSSVKKLHVMLVPFLNEELTKSDLGLPFANTSLAAQLVTDNLRVVNFGLARGLSHLALPAEKAEILASLLALKNQLEESEEGLTTLFGKPPEGQIVLKAFYRELTRLSETDPYVSQTGLTKHLERVIDFQVTIRLLLDIYLPELSRQTPDVFNKPHGPGETPVAKAVALSLQTLNLGLRDGIENSGTPEENEGVFSDLVDIELRLIKTPNGISHLPGFPSEGPHLISNFKSSMDRVRSARSCTKNMQFSRGDSQ